MRTAAPDNPHIFEEPRFRNRTTRPVTHWGIQGAQVSGPIALPGTYTVRLSVNGKTETQPLTLLRDPEISASEADLVASTTAQVRVRNDMNAAADLANKLELMRKQIADQVKANAEKPDVERALADLDKKMMDVELRLLSRSDMDSDDKYYVEPYRIYMSLIWLNGEVNSGAGCVARVARRHRTGPRRREGGVQVARRKGPRGIQPIDGGKASRHHRDAAPGATMSVR
jgi:hypothetical protein